MCAFLLIGINLSYKIELRFMSNFVLFNDDTILDDKKKRINLCLAHVSYVYF